MADAIVQTIKIQVEGTEEAAAEFRKVGDASNEAFAETQQGASQAGKSIEGFGKQAATGLGQTGQALDETTKKSGLTRREISALGKIMAAFGGGEIAHTAVSIGRVASALGALGAAAIGVGLAATALIKFGTEVIKTGDAIEKISRISSTPFEKVAGLQAAFRKIGITGEQFGNIMAGVFEKIATEAAKADEAISGSAKKIADAQLAVLKARAEAEPQLRSALAMDIKLAEEREKQNNLLAAESNLRKAEANDIEIVIAKYKQQADGIRAVFDPLTTLETKTQALAKVLEGLSFDKQQTMLARMFDTMDDLQKRDFVRVLKGLSFDDKMISQLEKGSRSLEKLRQQTAAAALKPEDAALVKTFGDAVEASSLQVMNFGQTLVIWFTKSVMGWKNVIIPILGQIGPAIESALEPVAAFLQKWLTAPVIEAWGWITTTFNDAITALEPLTSPVTAFITAWVTTPVANAWQWIKDTFAAVMQSVLGSTPTSDAGGGGGGSGFARGGLLGGRGSGMSDSNLAWVSRGEYIVPAGAVARPGVLAFLEALRLTGGNLRGLIGGMGHFAAGGLVVPSFAGGGMVGRNLGTLTLGLPGGSSVTVRASSDVVDQLRRAAAMGQVRSGGRKPSRYS